MHDQRAIRAGGQAWAGGVGKPIGLRAHHHVGVGHILHLDPPGHLPFSAIGHAHSLTRRFADSQPLGLQRDLDLLLRAGVVADQRRELRPVADHEEARRRRPHQERLGDQQFIGLLADLRALGDAHGAEDPGGQVIGQLDLHAGLTVPVGDHVGVPEGGILEALAQLGA